MTSEPSRPPIDPAFFATQFGQNFLEDIYRWFGMLRQMSPAFHDPRTDLWYVARHDDVDEVLRSPDYGKDPRKAKDADGLKQIFLTGEGQDPSMLVLDPPEHTRLRALVNKAFTPHSVETLRPRVQQVVDELLDAVADADSFDLMDALAAPLPIRIIAEMIGVDPAHALQFREWSHDLAASLDMTASAEQLEKARRAGQGLHDYYRGVIAEHRAAPHQDLISGLISAEEQGARLSDSEMVSILTLLLVAGNVTTTDLIGNGVLALLQHRDQLEKLQNDPSLITNAVEEILRYDPPVVGAHRVSLNNVEIGGCPVPAGQAILAAFPGANRDPSVYPEPDVFDVTRKDVHHHSFGAGPHFCLGAPLARLEAGIALGTLVRRFPNLTLDESRPPERRYLPAFRGLVSLHVRTRRP
jgi:cytochrome P450